MIVKKISKADIEPLSCVYKEVFSGTPWYEERICSGSKEEGEGKCKIQYTSRALPKDYAWKADFEKREGIVGSVNGLENCMVCGRKLIEFYPDFVDQKKLIEQAIEMPGFIGFALEAGKEFVGFSWGYRVPKDMRTESVNFPIIAPLLAEQGLEAEQTFYGAELGIVDRMQDSGLGFMASGARLNEARRQKYRFFVLRTKNPKVISIGRKAFSGQEGRKLFNDPQNGTPWYAWDFRNFNEEAFENLR